jgi:hypothetical protein
VRFRAPLHSCSNALKFSSYSDEENFHQCDKCLSWFLHGFFNVQTCCLLTLRLISLQEQEATAKDGMSVFYDHTILNVGKI